MSVAQAFARDGGSATLRVQVLAANEGARATYEQLGFRPRLLSLRSPSPRDRTDTQRWPSTFRKFLPWSARLRNDF